MSEPNPNLKERVRAFWQANPCGTKFADAEPGTRRFYELVEAHRYEKEWHIPAAADFAATRGLRVLEIGCGLGTDGAQFAKAGADYTGVDLTEAAVELARKRFELFNLSGTFPDTARAVREIHRVLKKNGKAIVMLYHRNSYNYRVNIRLLRRGGVHLLRWSAGMQLVHKLTGEPIESLRAHARKLREGHNGYLSAEEFLSQNTDGAGNPLARVYSRREVRELFQDFAGIKLRAFFLNKRFIPLLGNLLPRSVETQLAARWGWHLWIYATK